MDSITIRIKTLTPIWTGGVDGNCDRVHETGILGSLRWWYETIVRGLGGKACDPSKHGCSFDMEKYRKTQSKLERERLQEAGLCDVCQVFGATGWKRRFRARVVEQETSQTWVAPPDMINVRPPDRARGWYLPSGHVGNITIQFHGEAQILSLLAKLFLFLEQWGSFGAKPQSGYGFFRIENYDTTARYAADRTWEKMGDEPSSDIMPDLHRFSFFRFRFWPDRPTWWTWIPALERLMGRKDTAKALQRAAGHRVIPISPILRNEWRFCRWEGPYRAERSLFGTSRGSQDRVRSKIGVSWAYQTGKEGDEWNIGGWIWFPKKDDRNQNIPSDAIQQLWKTITDQKIWESVLKVKKGQISTVPSAREWKERTPNEVLQLLDPVRDRPDKRSGILRSKVSNWMEACQ